MWSGHSRSLASLWNRGSRLLLNTRQKQNKKAQRPASWSPPFSGCEVSVWLAELLISSPIFASSSSRWEPDRRQTLVSNPVINTPPCTARRLPQPFTTTKLYVLALLAPKGTWNTYLGCQIRKEPASWHFLISPFSIWGIRAVCAGPLQLPDTLLVNKTSIKENNLPDKPLTGYEWRQHRECFRKSQGAATGRVFHNRRGWEKRRDPVIVSVWPTDHHANVITRRVSSLLIHPADWRLAAWLHLVMHWTRFLSK